jgi:hypothetical protein
MGTYSKYKYVNTTFGGTSGVVVPNGTTAERDTSTVVGTLRYNTDLGLIEQYNAIGWQSVDAPPTIANISGTINENTNSTITISGSNFKTGAIVSIEGPAVSGAIRPLSTTFVATTTLTAATNAAAVNYVGGATFDIKVTNPSGLSGSLAPAGVIDRDPVWSTAAGTYSVFDGSRGTPLTFAAADPDGGTITFSVVSGSLPTGATLASSTGVISGFSAVASDTSSTFTLRATSSIGSQATDRTFTILVKAPIVQSFTTVTSTTFSVPTGVTNMDVLVVAGGGTGGCQHGGGGGAGGLIFRPAFPVTPGSSIPVTVGAGGDGMPGAGSLGQWTPAGDGKDSVFGSLTAKGGGLGSSHTGGGGSPGKAGGCGGGGNSDPSGVPPGGPGTQPAQPGDSGTFGFGNAGGAGRPGPGFPNWVGGGGGGAGAVGTQGPGTHAGNGGVGRAYSISGAPVFYAGGGGGAQHGGAVSGSFGLGGNGGGGDGNRTAHNSTNNFPGPRGSAGVANRGGGAGGSASGGVTITQPGGSGVVIIKY